MPEDIRLAKGEDLDALEDIVNNHIGSDETHVTAGDKQNWNGKADVAMLETEGYLKKKVVGVLPSMSVGFGFSDGVSKFNAINRCTVSVAEESDGNKYQKIVTGSNAANMYAFAYLDFSKYTANAKELIIEFDTKINTDRWYIGLSDLKVNLITSILLSVVLIFYCGKLSIFLSFIDAILLSFKSGIPNSSSI